MSLFKAREWWSAKNGSEELFDLGLLAVGNIDNSASGCAKIVVGSFQGFIRIYDPHPPHFVASHVILEKELGVPVIQLGLGKFLVSSEQICLCVLSPHRLAVFALSKDDTGGTRGIGGKEAGEGVEPSYTLLPLYTHQLRRTAANMIWGYFDTQNRVEQVCVQSMDGQLSFFSPSSHSFSCFLPDFLLPGPLTYLPITHTLVTSNSAHQLLFFRYQSLAVMGARMDEEEAASKSTGNTGKKLTPERVVNLGEHVVQLQVVHDDTGSTHILVLGERSVYCLNQNGVVMFMKKLEVGASCLWAYQVLSPGEESGIGPASVGAASSVSSVKSVSSVSSIGVSGVRSASSSTTDIREGGSGRNRDRTVGSERSVGKVRSMLATDSGQLLVMQDDALIWTASLPHIPVQITTADFQELRGVLVSLDQEGHVTCSYLGTDPTLFTAMPAAARFQGSQEEMEKELWTINKAIKSSKSDLTVARKDGVCVQLSTVCDPNLVRIVEVDKSPEDDMDGDGEERVWQGAEDGENKYKPLKKCLEVQVLVKCEGGGAVKDVIISVTAPLPLTTHPAHFRLGELSSANPPDAFILTVVCTPSLLPVNTTLTLSATFTTLQDRTEVVDQEVRLPLQLFSEPIYPEKTGQFKITVDSAPCEGNLSNLFPSVLVLSEAPPHALGLRYLCGPTVTVVASKTATQRYRLQSDSLPAIGVTLRWLLHRLYGYYRGRTPPFTAKFTPPLPLTEYFEILEHHYKVRKDLEQCWEWLSRHAHQFRAIQKRLLTRFKDKTPVGLAHLDTLLDGTYMQLNALIDKSEAVELELQAATNHLTCATLLIITLLKLAANLGEEDSAILTATFSPHVSTDIADQGWAEQVDAGVLHLLQTSLSKSSREQVTGAALLSLTTTPDNQKLKKHIALLCDRILKGYRPSGPRLEVTQSLSAAKASSGQEVAPVMLDPPPVTASLSKDPLAAAPVNATAAYRKHPGPAQRRPSMPALQEHSSETAS